MKELALSSIKSDDPALLSGQYWGELRIFAEVARARSFNKAAERLGISQPTIGRKVRRLQDLIGAQLFVSTKQGVQLTPRGEELAAALLVLDQSLFALASDLKARDRDAEGIVRVSLSDGMAAFFAAPAVPAFSARHPRIMLHLRGISIFGELHENQTDMMLTPAPPPPRADLACVKLGVLHLLPFASPAYLAYRGMPQPDTLDGHLFVQSHVYETDAPIWRDWQAMCARGRIAHFCDNPFAYGMMVREGLGIGLLGSYTMHEERLTLLDLPIHVPVQMYAVALIQRLKSPPVRLVFDWLCATFAETQAWFQPHLDVDALPTSMPAVARMLGS